MDETTAGTMDENTVLVSLTIRAFLRRLNSLLDFAFFNPNVEHALYPLIDLLLAVFTLSLPDAATLPNSTEAGFFGVYPQMFLSQPHDDIVESHEGHAGHRTDEAFGPSSESHTDSTSSTSASDAGSTSSNDTNYISDTDSIEAEHGGFAEKRKSSDGKKRKRKDWHIEPDFGLWLFSFVRSFSSTFRSHGFSIEIKRLPVAQSPKRWHSKSSRKAAKLKFKTREIVEQILRNLAAARALFPSKEEHYAMMIVGPFFTLYRLKRHPIPSSTTMPLLGVEMMFQRVEILYFNEPVFVYNLSHEIVELGPRFLNAFRLGTGLKRQHINRFFQCTADDEGLGFRVWAPFTRPEREQFHYKIDVSLDPYSYFRMVHLALRETAGEASGRSQAPSTPSASPASSGDEYVLSDESMVVDEPMELDD